MSSADFARISDVFNAARRLPTEERRAFLVGIDDIAVRLEVEKLLADYEQILSNEFLETPALGERFDLSRDDLEFPERVDPDSVGAYDIEERMGEGGMGIVYRAVHRTTGRRVALKVIRSPVATRDVLQRFALEARILSRLEHHGIARIHDAGVDQGRTPYIAMEIVAGEPLGRYAETHDLGPRARVRLVLDVCRAAEHAHQRGVIHRDLKPSNILVEHGPDGRPSPKIVDFGVARAVDGIGGPGNRATATGQLVGTIEYMSPEQLAGDAAEVDTRADVHALGVILYELISGRLPRDCGTRNPIEYARFVELNDPRPLTAVNATIPRDLDAICAKALRRDKRDRYASVTELAADLARFLADEPVLARPASLTYVLSRFARRHRALVAAIAVGFVVSTLGVAATVWQAVRAARASERAGQAEHRASQRALEAERRAAEAHRSIDYLSRLLWAPIQGGRDVTVLHMIGHVAENLRETFASEPWAEVMIRTRICSIYRKLGGLEASARQGELAVALADDRLAADDPRTLQALRALAITRLESGAAGEAERLLRLVISRTPVEVRLLDDVAHVARSLREQWKSREGVDLLERALESGARAIDDSVVRAEVELALTREAAGRAEEAAETLGAFLSRAREVLGEDSDAVLTAANSLAALQSRRGRHVEAERISRAALARRLHHSGENYHATLTSMNNLAVALENLGRFDEARGHYERALRGRRRLLGEGHVQSVTTLANLAGLLVDMGLFVEAAPYLDDLVRLAPDVVVPGLAWNRVVALRCGEVLHDAGRPVPAAALVRPVREFRLERLGMRHPSTLAATALLAKALVAAGKTEEGDRLRRECLEGRKEVLGPDHRDTLATMHEEASALARAGRDADARDLLRDVLARRRELLGPAHGRTLSTMTNLGHCELALGAVDVADRLFDEAVRLSEGRSEINRVATVSALQGKAYVAAERGRNAEAERILLELLRRVEQWGSRHPRIMTIREQLGSSLVALPGRRADGLHMLRELVEDRTAVQGPEHPATSTTMHNLASALAREPVDHDEAAALYEKTLELRRRVLGGGHRKTIATIYNYAWLERERHAFDRAYRLLEEGLAALGPAAAHEDWLAAELSSLQGATLLDLGRPHQAVPVLEAAVAALRRLLGRDHHRTRRAAANLRAARQATPPR